MLRKFFCKTHVNNRKWCKTKQAQEKAGDGRKIQKENLETLCLKVLDLVPCWWILSVKGVCYSFALNFFSFSKYPQILLVQKIGPSPQFNSKHLLSSAFAVTEP